MNVLHRYRVYGFHGLHFSNDGLLNYHNLLDCKSVPTFRRKVCVSEKGRFYPDTLTSNSHFLLSHCKPPLLSSMSVILVGHNPCIFRTPTSPSHYGQRDWVTVISNPRHQSNKIFPAKIYCHLYQKYSKWYNRRPGPQPITDVSQRKQIPLCRNCTGRFIMFSVITNIYNKKTKGPTLMEFFTATGKLSFFLN